MYCRAGAVTSSDKAVKLLLQRSPGESPEATAAAAQAASAEATANADPSNAASYGARSGESAVLDGPLVAKMTVASAASLPQVGLAVYRQNAAAQPLALAPVRLTLLSARVLTTLGDYFGWS